MPMDDRLAKLLLEDNIVTRLKQAEGDIDLLQKLATIKSVDLQTLPIPGTTNPPQAVNPGGVDTSVQYNDGGLFGGDANLTWNKTTQTLTLKASAEDTPNMQGVALGGDAIGINIHGGDRIDTDEKGGTVKIQAGKGYDTRSGGWVHIWSGDGGDTGGAGDITLFGGTGGATSGDGGQINLTAGNALTSGDGGSIALTPGTGAGAGTDGIVTINGDVHFENDNMIWDKTNKILTINHDTGGTTPNIQGISDGTAPGLYLHGGDGSVAVGGGGIGLVGGAGIGTSNGGGSVELQGGEGGAEAGGGIINIMGGIGGATSGDGGSINITSGYTNTGNGGAIYITSGDTNTGNGGELLLSGGDVAISGNGGDVNIRPGVGAGAGVDGIVGISNSDLHILGAGATGLVLYDATLGGYYRITLDNGVLIITAV